MRIDKFLKNSRLIKRRTVAKSACEGGRVLVNNRVAKPGTNVEVGDEITLAFGNGEKKIKVLMTPEHVRKEDVETMYEVIS